MMNIVLFKIQSHAYKFIPLSRMESDKMEMFLNANKIEQTLFV